MSSRASSLAWSLPGLPALERLVLLKLADVCDDEGSGRVAELRELCRPWIPRTDFVEALRRLVEWRLVDVLDDVEPAELSFCFELLFVRRPVA